MQHYQKMSNQSTKKSTWIEFVLFKCTKEMGINDFGCSMWIAHFISILKRTCEKRFMEYVRLQLNLYPQAGQHAFNWTISPPFEDTHFMDDPFSLPCSSFELFVLFYFFNIIKFKTSDKNMELFSDFFKFQ